MKKLIIIPLITLSISTKSGVQDIERNKAVKELELIEDTLSFVKSKYIKRDMIARKARLIKKM